MGVAINEGKLNLPGPERIAGTNMDFPYVFVGDEAFPLKENLMKPFPREMIHTPERIYNYRLSRARIIIENTFGILAARFRIFRRQIIARESVVINITKATVALHNLLMKGRDFGPKNDYCPSNFVDRETPNGIQNGGWRDEVSGNEGMRPLNVQISSNNYSREAKKVHESFRDFFNYSPRGQVPWQREMVTSTD